MIYLFLEFSELGYEFLIFLLDIYIFVILGKDLRFGKEILS